MSGAEALFVVSLALPPAVVLVVLLVTVLRKPA